jgi:RNA polymerase sigma factor (TIGR02999 family)
VQELSTHGRSAGSYDGRSAARIERSGLADPTDKSLTILLQAWREGDGSAYASLFEGAYAELKQIASQRIGVGQASDTLSPTALVNEAVVRVMGSQLRWEDRNHFFASMSLYMRTILIDHARARLSDKRGGKALHLTLDHIELGEESQILDLLALDSALRKLESLDPRSSSVLHLTYFAGMGRQQIAELLSVSVQVVDRELRFSKTWLNTHIDAKL